MIGERRITYSGAACLELDRQGGLGLYDREGRWMWTVNAFSWSAVYIGASSCIRKRIK